MGNHAIRLNCSHNIHNIDYEDINLTPDENQLIQTIYFNSTQLNKEKIHKKKSILPRKQPKKQEYISIVDFMDMIPYLLKPIIIQLLLIYRKFKIDEKFKKSGILSLSTAIKLISHWTTVHDARLEQNLLDFNFPIDASSSHQGNLHILLAITYIIFTYRLIYDQNNHLSLNNSNSDSDPTHLNSTFSKQSSHNENQTIWITLSQMYQVDQFLQFTTSSFFKPLLQSYEDYRLIHTNKLNNTQPDQKLPNEYSIQYDLIFDWIKIILPNLLYSFKINLKTIILNSNLTEHNSNHHSVLNKITDNSQTYNINQINKGINFKIFIDASHFLSSPSVCLKDALLCFALRQAHPLLNETTPWSLLYASRKHGSSLTQLLSRVEYYPAPMILALKTINEEYIGASIFGRMEDQHGKYSVNSDIFLWKYGSSFNVYRSHGANNYNHLYINYKNNHYPKGIGFGGRIGTFRLWITNDLTQASCLNYDTAYEPGHLFDEPPNSDITLISLRELEIWGTGADTVENTQHREKERHRKIIEDHRKIDLKKFYSNEFNREIILGRKNNADITN